MTTIRKPSDEHPDPRECEARRAGVGAVLAPLPAEELREVVGAREGRVDRRAGDGEQDPHEREDQADLPERRVRDERDRAEKLGVDPLREEERAGRDHQREREQTAQRVADQRVGPVQPQVLRAQLFLDRARGVEVDLVRNHGGADQADDVVRVDASRPPCPLEGTKPCATEPQSGWSLIAATTKTSSARPQ